MKGVRTSPVHTATYSVSLSLLAACAVLFAQGPRGGEPSADAPPQQQSPAPSAGWHRFPRSSSSQVAGARQEGDPPNRSAQTAASDPPNQSVPSRLTLRRGAFVSVRVDQLLSSDKNHAGDGFTATLEQPLVVNGLVVAQRGQTVAGRVAEAQKAGRVKGVSRLALELTDLTLVDGQQVPIRTQFTGWNGPKSVGRDATAVATTSALGAAVGVAAGGGVGAAIGAGAGAVAATVGVLLTRGRPTVIYPESMLTFRIEAPVAISTDRAPQAFRYVEADAYDRPQLARRPWPRPNACAGYGCPPPPPPYYYRPAYYPYYWGPAVAFWYGPRFYYGPRFFYGRGFVYRR